MQLPALTTLANGQQGRGLQQARDADLTVAATRREHIAVKRRTVQTVHWVGASQRRNEAWLNLMFVKPTRSDVRRESKLGRSLEQSSRWRLGLSRITTRCQTQLFDAVCCLVCSFCILCRPGLYSHAQIHI